MEELEEDRLSSLPKVILHLILSKLPEKDAARASVLSKDWLDTWYTFPILSFCGRTNMGKSLAQPMDDSERMRKILGFCDYVKKSILRFRDQRLAIKEFKLNMNLSALRYFSKEVDIWLKLACECGVEVIEYTRKVLAGNDGQDEYHVLPMYVIEAKSLTKLVLYGFIKIDPTFMNHSIKFSSLRVLSLWRVLFGDEHAINRLVSFCPLIESIHLRNCYVLSSDNCTKKRMKSLNINGLQKLKRVDAFEIQNVSIDAPSLETLCYTINFISPFNIDFNIDFDRCRNLKELSMFSVSIGTFFIDKKFLDQFSKFHFLECLKLNSFKMPERIHISSVSLKMLELSHCSNLKEVIIEAPNLLSCDYKGNGASKPTIFFSRNSSHLKVNIRINVHYEDLCNLREFVQNIKPKNVLTSLSLFIDHAFNAVMKDALDRVAMQASSPPPSIECLTILYVPDNKDLFASLVNILLSSCCPETIYLRSGGKEFIEFFYETITRRKVDKCFCSSYDIKCWWHGLKDVKITSSKKMDQMLILRPF